MSKTCSTFTQLVKPEGQTCSTFTHLVKPERERERERSTVEVVVLRGPPRSIATFILHHPDPPPSPVFFYFLLLLLCEENVWERERERRIMKFDMLVMEVRGNEKEELNLVHCCCQPTTFCLVHYRWLSVWFALILNQFVVDVTYYENGLMKVACGFMKLKVRERGKEISKEIGLKWWCFFCLYTRVKSDSFSIESHCSI